MKHTIIKKIYTMQDKIIEELGSEMDSTSNRLDFVQVIFLLFRNIGSFKLVTF